MKFRKNTQNDTEKLLKKASKCRPYELRELLNIVEIEIENSKSRNDDLFIAKTIITSRLASMKNRYD